MTLAQATMEYIMGTGRPSIPICTKTVEPDPLTCCSNLLYSSRFVLLSVSKLRNQFHGTPVAENGLAAQRAREVDLATVAPNTGMFAILTTH